jgi:hypothetical protein
VYQRSKERILSGMRLNGGILCLFQILKHCRRLSVDNTKAVTMSKLARGRSNRFIYDSTAFLDLGPFFSFLIHTQSVGLLGRG